MACRACGSRFRLGNALHISQTRATKREIVRFMEGVRARRSVGDTIELNEKIPSPNRPVYGGKINVSSAIIPNMGNPTATASLPGIKPVPNVSLPDALFTRTQQRVLGILYGHPVQRFSVSEIIAQAKVGSGAVSRELLRLQRTRLVAVIEEGRRKYYQANKEAAIYEELHGLVKKTLGFVETIRAGLEPFKEEVELALIYGSVAKGNDTAISDIDLMIVSDSLHSFEVFDRLIPAMGELRRLIEIRLYGGEEFRDHCKRNRNGFVRRVLEGPTHFVIGSKETVDEIC